MNRSVISHVDIYGHNYYAVFFKDPDGNPLEVVCYESEE